MLCRDKCGYCTFAQPPARLDVPYLTPDQVLDIARAGAAVGCHEALFTLGERPARSSAAWLLVVSDDRHPLGWVEPERIGDREVTDADLHRGGTVARLAGSLRGALDAALSSPSRRGVIVDESGALAGTVQAHEVLTAIEETDRPERDEEDPVHGGASAVLDGATP